jgi:phage N-6-adenine-methyltransferase
MVGCPSCGAPDDQGCYKWCSEVQNQEPIEPPLATYLKSKMPAQKPSKSKQDYGTPKDLLDAIRHRLGIWGFDWDLAASAENTVVQESEDGKRHYDEKDNALVQEWYKIEGWSWLNPPFADIKPWVKKAYEESQMGAHIVMLVPTSFAEWWRDWVEGKCYVVHLQGRVTFVDCTTAYPKDVSLLIYTPFGFKGSELWGWR